MSVCYNFRQQNSWVVFYRLFEWRKDSAHNIMADWTRAGRMFSRHWLCSELTRPAWQFSRVSRDRITTKQPLSYILTWYLYIVSLLLSRFHNNCRSHIVHLLYGVMLSVLRYDGQINDAQRCYCGHKTNYCKEPARVVLLIPCDNSVTSVCMTLAESRFYTRA